jgi:predicted transposase/invertase (TIGR01784 family)
VQSREGWLYIYLLIEFQSRVDPHMALRIMVYTGLLYQDLLKSGAIPQAHKLPPVFPIVIYNGEGKWTAARDMADLIEPFGGCLAAYRPSQRHFVLDEGRVSESECKQIGNTLADIIQLESSPDPDAVRQVVSRLTLRMKEARYDSLRRALVVWINRVVLKRVVPDENIPELNELQEIDNMLAERMDQWVEKLKQEGRQKGRQEGEGRLLGRQLERRFGPLPAWAKERITASTPEQIEAWAERIFDAATLEAIFDCH